MKVDVIIVNYNTKQLLKDCLDSIGRQIWLHELTVWVVDNGSSDGSAQMVKKDFGQVKLIETGQNLGFSQGNNQVLDTSVADYCLLLNSDTIVLEGAIDGLVDFAKESKFGIASCRLENKDGSFQPNAGDRPNLVAVFNTLSLLDDLFGLFGMVVPSLHQTNKKYYLTGHQVGWVSGSVMLIKRSVIQKIGSLDKAIFMYGEDVEYCIRAAKADIKVGWTNQAVITHLGGASSKDPSFNQWLGEFKGLLYIARKYGFFGYDWLFKLMFYVFIFLRVVVFWLIGRRQAAKTYVRIISAI